MLDRTKIPAAAPLHNVAFPAISTFQLSNGIKVHSCPFGSQEIIDITLIFPAGRCFETHAPVASFAAKLIQEGTKQRSSLEFARQLDFYGASLYAESTLEVGNVGLSCLTKHVASTLPLLREMLLEPLFAESELENLRQRTIQHLEVESKKTEYVALRDFNKVLFGTQHPYGGYAEKKDIEAIQMPAIRAFHQRNYNLVNAEIVVSGRYDEQALLSMLDQYLGAPDLADATMRVGEEESRGRNLGAEPEKHLHYVEMPDSMQGTIRLGHRAFSRQNQDHYPMQVVNTLLGGYFGSRLMTNIREDKGYTYGIGSGWIPMKYSGMFVVQTSVDNTYIQPTLTEIDKEIDLLMREGVEQDELDLVKNYMLGQSVSARELPEQIASSIRSMVVYGLPFKTLDEKFHEIQSVTVDDVHRLANQYLKPEKIIQVVSGKLD
jgi:predicted Zn-dependent peptidase